VGAARILGVPTLDSSEVNVTKRRVGIAAIIILMLAIGTWVALPKHGAPSGSAVIWV